MFCFQINEMRSILGLQSGASLPRRSLSSPDNDSIAQAQGTYHLNWLSVGALNVDVGSYLTPDWLGLRADSKEERTVEGGDLDNANALPRF